jgi:hypothetical protein
MARLRQRLISRGLLPSLSADRAEPQSLTAGVTHGGYLRLAVRAGVWPDSVQVPGETLSFSGCQMRTYAGLNEDASRRQ